MRSRFARLALLDALAWIVGIPLLAAALLGSMLEFRGWPDRLLPGGEDGEVALAAPPRVARVPAPSEPAPATRTRPPRRGSTGAAARAAPLRHAQRLGRLASDPLRPGGARRAGAGGAARPRGSAAGPGGRAAAPARPAGACARTAAGRAAPQVELPHVDVPPLELPLPL